MLRRTIFLVVAILLFSGEILSQRPTHEGKTVLFGNLHAHSKLSDDVSAGNEMLPLKAFEYAQEHGLDFLAISDHHKADDSPGMTLQMTATEYQDQLRGVATQYNTDQAGQFVAIAAMEWGNTATGNHLTIVGATGLPPDTVKDVDYDELYEWVGDNAEFVQFNHPNSWSNKSNRNQDVGNFAQALYEDEQDFVANVDSVVKTVSIITTVYGGHITGPLRLSEDKTHRKMQWHNYYKKFLNMGFHISPSASQDTHSANWGTVTAARTAVWADSVSYDDLMAGFGANRVYASQDDELVVAFQVGYSGSQHWMGETVDLSADEDDVDVLVKIWQAQGSDGDSVSEGPYTVDVFRDPDGVGGQRASILMTVEGILSETVSTIPVSVEAGQYIYVQVTEENGQDNPLGDGDDETNNDTGVAGADGKRDNMNDSAWTSPIWFRSVQFVWSKNSKIYHDPDCWAVKTIGDANRRTGPAPAGKSKHNCHP